MMTDAIAPTRREREVVHVEIDGRYIGRSECLGKDDYEQVGEDVGSGGRAPPDGVAEDGVGHHVVRVFTSRDRKSRHAEVLSGGLFGAATYRPGELIESAPGLEAEAVIEAYGSTWRRNGADQIPRGTRTYTKKITVGDEPLMASVVLGGEGTPVATRMEPVETEWDDDDQIRMESIGAGGGLSWLLLPGDTYEVSVSTAEGTFSGALVTYRPVD